MEQYGVQILRPVGEDIARGGDAARAYGFGGTSLRETRAAAAGIEVIGFANFLLVADPDGNLVEIQNKS